MTIHFRVFKPLIAVFKTLAFTWFQAFGLKPSESKCFESGKFRETKYGLTKSKIFPFALAKNLSHEVSLELSGLQTLK